MDPILSALQMTIQFASGTLKPISKLETHSGTTIKSLFLPCPPMDNTSPVLSLDRMQKITCGFWKQRSKIRAMIMSVCLFIVGVFSKWGFVVLQSADESNAAELKASCLHFPFTLYLTSSPGTPGSIYRCCMPISCENPYSLLIFSLDPPHQSGLQAAAQPQTRRLGEICQYNFLFSRNCNICIG
jgi:hypothetical protein